jgi:hypothetical protein
MEVLAKSSGFADPKTVAVPRRIDAHTDASMGAGPLDDRQLAKVDGVLALLHMNGLVELNDVYGPSEDGGYNHTITVRPAASAPADLFAETDEQPIAPPYAQVRRTIGWHVIIAHPKIIGVSRILDASNPEAERLSPGYVQAMVTFKWEPSEIGTLFDQNGSSFEDLPREVQQGAMNVGSLDSGVTYYGTAWMTRGKQGDWRVTLFQCRRCT